MEIEITLAKTLKDVEDAFKLVYISYVKQGYIKENSIGMHTPIWNILPTSYIVIARHDNEVVGTMVCITDGPSGIPMDSVAKEQICRLRNEGHELCELSSFATTREFGGTNLVFKMFQYVFKLAEKYLSISDFIIGVNPCHEKFYKSVLLFEHIIENDSYGRMNNVPVIVLKNDINTLKMRYKEKHGSAQEGRNLYDYLCGPQDILQKIQMEIDIDAYQELISDSIFIEILEKHNKTIHANELRYN